MDVIASLPIVSLFWKTRRQPDFPRSRFRGGRTKEPMNHANDDLKKDFPELCHPWLVAVWPGMGQVAVTAGYYLMAKLSMRQLAEFPAREFFDVNHIEVRDGLIRAGRQPRSRLFVWQDPGKNHDIIVFIGEAQPPSGKYPFCRMLIDVAKKLGVEKVFTFAAMATAMHPKRESRVFGAATDAKTLAELKRLELEILNEGEISGLNGVLLGVAAEDKLPGGCLLGEMPHFLTQIPFPKASLAVLEAFTAMARIDLDLTELAQQVKTMEAQLGGLMAQIEKAIGKQRGETGESSAADALEPESVPEMTSGKEDALSSADRDRIESLFHQVQKDRSKAYELKAELDRLRIFDEYEDRFLDLFKGSE